MNVNSDTVTCFELLKLYGISKSTTCRAIRSGSLNAYQLGYTDKKGNDFIRVKWYIEKDDKLDLFISEHRKK